jgi:hypothetical protein
MSGLRNAQYAITVNARNPNKAEPAARPSRPSVTLTAFVVAHTITEVQMTHRTGDNCHPGKSNRVNDKVSVYANVDNIFNQLAPPFGSPSIYDTIGRRYRAGVRLNF